LIDIQIQISSISVIFMTRNNVHKHNIIKLIYMWCLLLATKV